MSVVLSQAKPFKLTKKEQDLVNRFAYYCQELADSKLQSSNPKIVSETPHFQASIGNNEFHSLHLNRDTYQNQTLLTRDVVSQIAQLYLKPSDGHLLPEKSSQQHKGEHFGLNHTKGSQSVEFFVVEEKKREDPQQRGFQKKERSAITLGSTADLSELQNFSIYILHHLSETESKFTWSYFVQKISLQADPFSKPGQSLPIEYDAVIGFAKEGWLQQNVMKWFRSTKNLKQIEEILQGAKHRLDMFESGLAKTLAKLAKSQLQQSLNCHPQFKREDKLPPAHYKKFEKLKAQIYAYYSSINRNKKLNKYFLDNLICRFLILKKYEEKETHEALKKYLDWQKSMRGKYTIDSFKKYTQMGMFKYIGKDLQGRPVLYFCSNKYHADNIKDQQEYTDYNGYLLEIYLQDMMQGYIDEYSIIGDYRGFGMDNFNYKISVDFSALSAELFPERQHKLILFGLTPLAEWVIKIIKPFLADFIVRKINVFGTDLQEFNHKIKDYIDLRQLPTELQLKESELPNPHPGRQK